jgi:hypothetical protein
MGMAVFSVFLMPDMLGFGILNTAITMRIGLGFRMVQTFSRGPSSSASAPAVLGRGDDGETGSYNNCHEERKQTFHFSFLLIDILRMPMSPRSRWFHL